MFCLSQGIYVNAVYVNLLQFNSVFVVILEITAVLQYRCVQHVGWVILFPIYCVVHCSFWQVW